MIRLDSINININMYYNYYTSYTYTYTYPCNQYFNLTHLINLFIK